MRSQLRILAIVGAVLATVSAASPAGAVTSPAVTVAPDSALVDGQAVTVTATGFVAAAGRPGTFVPAAFECVGGVFPASATFFLDPTVIDQVNLLLNQSCTFLGNFPATNTSTTNMQIAVHRAFVTPNATTVQCGTSPGACAMVVLGLVIPPSPPNGGVASAPLTFGMPVAQSAADCKRDEWRNFGDTTGAAFRNQGHCVAFAVRH